LNEVIENIQTYGYIILFLYSLGGGFVGLVAAGVLSYIGKLDLATSIVVAFVANTIGDSLLFYVSRFNKDMFTPYIKKQKRIFALSTLLIKRYGSKIVFIQKFIYGVKTFVPIAMGLSKYNGLKFNVLNVVAALLWAVVIGVGSFYMSELFLKVFGFITDNPYIMPIILVLILGCAYLYLKWIADRSKRRRRRATH